VFHQITKKAKGPKCGDCGGRIHGVKHLRPMEAHRAPKRLKTVTRAYGGNRCATCVRNRIVRAFLIEEQKIVKRVLKLQKTPKTKAATKA